MLTREEWVALAKSIGETVAEKNKAYGDSVRKATVIMSILYPEIPIETLAKVLLTVRVLDKLSRIANDPKFNNEDPALDIAGYALLFHDLITNGVKPEEVCDDSEE
jgi:hypothetical protein